MRVDDNEKRASWRRQVNAGANLYSLSMVSAIALAVYVLARVLGRDRREPLSETMEALTGVVPVLQFLLVTVPLGVCVFLVSRQTPVAPMRGVVPILRRRFLHVIWSPLFILAGAVSLVQDADPDGGGVGWVAELSGGLRIVVSVLLIVAGLLVVVGLPLFADHVRALAGRVEAESARRAAGRAGLVIWVTVLLLVASIATRAVPQEMLNRQEAGLWAVVLFLVAGACSLLGLLFLWVALIGLTVAVEDEPDDPSEA